MPSEPHVLVQLLYEVSIAVCDRSTGTVHLILFSISFDLWVPRLQFYLARHANDRTFHNVCQTLGGYKMAVPKFHLDKRNPEE